LHRETDGDIWWCNISGGTDFCGAFIGGNRELPQEAGVMQCRLLGCAVEAWNEAGEPVHGEVGELVVTTLNPDYPLIRFGTGDLTAILPGTCATGRTNQRIKGWLGRADQTTKMRGMFVHPGQVDQVVKRFAQILKARLVVSGEMAQDDMQLLVETSHSGIDWLDEVAQAVRDITKLRADIVPVAPGSLPNDGKVIEDARSYK
jgi:phenylacetate-CoA ligase